MPFYLGAGSINIRRRSVIGGKGAEQGDQTDGLLSRSLVGSADNHNTSGCERCPTKRVSRRYWCIGLSLLLVTLLACLFYHHFGSVPCRGSMSGDYYWRTMRLVGSILSFDLPEESKLLDLRQFSCVFTFTSHLHEQELSPMPLTMHFRIARSRSQTSLRCQWRSRLHA